LQSVFLQFDSLEEAQVARLRGRGLVKEKKRALQAMAQAGLGVVLVPTLVPGINTDQIGELLRFAISGHPAVRGIHFQPISYFGRYPEPPADGDRLTLPEIIRHLETQSEGAVQRREFLPPGCEHALCSFHASYLLGPDGGLKHLGQTCCGSEPIEAADGARQTVRMTAQKWQLPPAPDPSSLIGADDLDRFLAAARYQTFTVSAMAFQDAWTIDLERLQGCCIHVSTPDGRLIPFCAYNLTAADGRPLYRNGAGP
jgi:hypothetical protein